MVYIIQAYFFVNIPTIHMAWNMVRLRSSISGFFFIPIETRWAIYITATVDGCNIRDTKW